MVTLHGLTDAGRDVACTLTPIQTWGIQAELRERERERRSLTGSGNVCLAVHGLHATPDDEVDA